MIDQLSRVNQVVRDELKKNALGDQVGYAVTQAFAPVQAAAGQTGLFFSWIVTVTLRNPLLGYDDFSFMVVIPTQMNMPPDKAFAGAAVMALEGVRKMREEAMNGDETTTKGTAQLAA